MLRAGNGNHDHQHQGCHGGSQPAPGPRGRRIRGNVWARSARFRLWQKEVVAREYPDAGLFADLQRNYGRHQWLQHEAARDNYWKSDADWNLYGVGHGGA